MQADTICKQIDSLKESSNFNEEITDLLISISKNYEEFKDSGKLSKIHQLFTRLDKIVAGKTIDDVKTIFPDIKLLDLSLGTEFWNSGIKYQDFKPPKNELQHFWETLIEMNLLLSKDEIQYSYKLKTKKGTVLIRQPGEKTWKTIIGFWINEKAENTEKSLIFSSYPILAREMATPHEYLDNSNPILQRTFGFAVASGSYAKLFSEIESEFLESVSALTFKDCFQLIPQTIKAHLGKDKHLSVNSFPLMNKGILIVLENLIFRAVSTYDKSFTDPKHGFEIEENSMSDVLSESVAFSIKSILGRIFGRSKENDISYSIESLSQLHPADTSYIVYIFTQVCESILRKTSNTKLESSWDIKYEYSIDDSRSLSEKRKIIEDISIICCSKWYSIKQAHLINSKAAPKAEPTSADAKNKAEEAKQAGNEFYKQNQFKEAIDAYSKAIELDPQNITYLTNRATSYFELKEWDLAISDCKRAIDFPHLQFVSLQQKSRAYERLADVLVKKGDKTKAGQMYKIALNYNFSNEIVAKFKKIGGWLSSVRPADIEENPVIEAENMDVEVLTKYHQLVVSIGLFLKNNFLLALSAISTLLESLVQEKYQKTFGHCYSPKPIIEDEETFIGLQKINCRIIANLPNGFLDEKEFSIIKNLYGGKNSLLKLLDMGFLGKVEPDVVADIILLVNLSLKILDCIIQKMFVKGVAEYQDWLHSVGYTIEDTECKKIKPDMLNLATWLEKGNWKDKQLSSGNCIII